MMTLQDRTTSVNHDTIQAARVLAGAQMLEMLSEPFRSTPLPCGQGDLPLSPLSAVLGNLLFGSNAEIVAERVPNIRGDSGYFPIRQVAEWGHVGAATDDLNGNLSHRQIREVAGKSWYGIRRLLLAFSVASVTSSALALVDARPLGRHFR